MKNVLKSALMGLMIVVAFLTTAPTPSRAVTLNPGDILVADLNAFGGPGAIFRVHPTTGAQTIVSSEGSFTGPAGIAITPSGDLLITNAGGPVPAPGSIIRVNPATGAQTTVSSGGYLLNPVCLAIAADGALFVGDLDGGIIRVDPATGGQTLVSGPRGPSAIVIAPNGDVIAGFNAIDANGDLLATDFGGRRIIRVDPTSAETVISSGGSLVAPNSLAIAANGDIFVVDQGANAVIRVDPISGAQTVVSSGGFFDTPVGIAMVPGPLRQLAPASLWVGLKNSDDQGTQFDLRVEVYVGNTLVSAGVTRCVTGVTRNPSNAKQVAVSFGAISGGVPESGDIVSLKVPAQRNPKIR